LNLISTILTPGSTSNPIAFKITIAQIPGLNTLGLALGRGDYAPGGTSTLHTHPRATEITTVLDGSLIAGFVTSNPENRLVWKVLQKGDVFVFPIGLVHFTFNAGNGPTATMAAFTSQSPGFIRVGDLFATNPSIPDDILAKAFQVDESVIRKLRS
jgi:quercetin dioxygenase-like cupin family protein